MFAVPHQLRAWAVRLSGKAAVGRIRIADPARLSMFRFVPVQKTVTNSASAIAGVQPMARPLLKSRQLLRLKRHTDRLREFPVFLSSALRICMHSTARSSHWRLNCPVAEKNLAGLHSENSPVAEPPCVCVRIWPSSAGLHILLVSLPIVNRLYPPYLVVSTTLCGSGHLAWSISYDRET